MVMAALETFIATRQPSGQPCTDEPFAVRMAPNSDRMLMRRHSSSVGLLRRLPLPQAISHTFAVTLR
jgi:hypothetical protein